MQPRPLSAIDVPSTDPTPIFELFRANYSTELLTAAVAEFNLFGVLAAGPLTFEELRRLLDLAERPAVVLLCAMRAMQLIEQDGAGRLALTPLAAEHLTPGGPFEVGDYVRLVSDAPGVRELVERLRSNSPAGQKAEQAGAAFIYREGLDSAMEKEASARHFTLALAGRAKNVAPLLARKAGLEKARTLIDVGGGTGIYSIACLQRNPGLRAVVWDRPEVLKIAAEMAQAYGVADRLICQPGDMFADPVPVGDVILVSNILHDWDVPDCRRLISRLASPLPSGGRLLIHDVYLNDALDGPLPIALYSTALFSLTEGRAYSAAEYRTWLIEAGLSCAEIIPTLVHCGILPGTKA